MLAELLASRSDNGHVHLIDGDQLLHLVVDADGFDHYDAEQEILGHMVVLDKLGDHEHSIVRLESSHFLSSLCLCSS